MTQEAYLKRSNVAVATEESYLSLRIFGGIICLLGILIISGLIYISSISFRQANLTGFLDHFLHLIRYDVPFSGIIPFLILAPFLTIFKTPNQFGFGFLCVMPLMIFSHFVLMVFIAHAEFSLPHIILQAIHLSLLLYLVIKRKSLFIRIFPTKEVQ